MSRLYGKSVDVYSASYKLVDRKIPKYKRDRSKTTWEEVIISPEEIEIYLPQNAIDIIEKNPIKIIQSPLAFKSASLLPKNDKEEPVMFFPRYSAIEEYKRELVFFLGELLSSKVPDKLPDDNSIPCEYSDVLGLLLEYLYLKENGKEDSFSSKHLNELLYNAKRYVKSYRNFQSAIVSKKSSELYLYRDSDIEKMNNNIDKMEKQFLDATLINLVPLSSMDAVLQIVDQIESKEDIKELIRVLVENENHDRQNILHDYGIDSFGYKRLTKEIDRRL